MTATIGHGDLHEVAVSIFDTRNRDGSFTGTDSAVYIYTLF